MEKSNFVDQIKIFCRSGHGGAGSKHFMRNKLTAMGGPDGGDGGRGAHIILKGNSQLWTLLHLRYYKNILAEDGENGSKNNSSGRTGKDQMQSHASLDLNRHYNSFFRSALTRTSKTGLHLTFNV